MRNLQECQAEIFRRSELRIRKRKQRRIAIGSSLAVCLAVACLVFLPSGGKTAIAPKEELVTEYAMSRENELHIEPEALPLITLSEILLSAPEHIARCTDPGKMDEILGLLTDAQECDPLYSNTVGGLGQSEPETQPETMCRDFSQDDALQGDDVKASAPVYTLTLIYLDGSQNSYTITGRVLENLTTGCQYPLTPEALEVLTTALGVELTLP